MGRSIFASLLQRHTDKGARGAVRTRGRRRFGQRRRGHGADGAVGQLLGRVR
jgi:PII-like signaling protein